MSTVVENKDTNGAAPLTTTSGSSSSDQAENAKAEGQLKEVQLKQLYEQSTQYNHWRYTQAALDNLRNKVNQEAIACIKQNIGEERLSVDGLPKDLSFLKVEEELALLGFYERKIVQIFQHWKLPSHTTATAIVYMKRFYLENTVMDYHPKDVMMTCMFLARKTENVLMNIEDFTKALKALPSAILNLEFLVCKNLRFHFTVHHPYRPCLGFFYDMQAVTDNMERLQRVYEAALKLIDTSLHTDLCFLYQPSQIALAALRIACQDESYDFESTTQKYNQTLLPILESIENVLKTDPRCVEVDRSVVQEIDRRLKTCKDPAKNPESLM
ncbi:cyclin-like protein [Lobosporangium transversale]|uniref:Cyclin-like protein n=1 Tax=Lobosporangium transversale TaxID=64571 RepID=A0A1Y2GDT5_9FUNG|nr:cyclin-like protein [Lobosporangium transversale]ORZ08009.1 cyclin-like protein [Lobosporangium transversale]|eukprot:XP_021878243.1 cyclin-like protein [Lobosporangium transversale]